MSMTTTKITGPSPVVAEMRVHKDKRATADGERRLQLAGSVMSTSVGLSLMLCQLLLSVLVRVLVKLLELTGIKRLQVEEKRLSISTDSQANKSPANLTPQTTRLQPPRVPLPIQMSQKVVAGFEEQQVAHELSAQVVTEALRDIVEQLEEGAKAGAKGSEANMAAIVAAEESQVSQQDYITGKERHEELCEEEISRGEDKNFSKTKTQNSSSNASVKDEEELDMSFGESLASSRDSDEYAGQQASEITLRQLKLSALEDVLVCGQNRHSTESARRLFAKLSSPDAHGQKPPPGIEISSVARRYAKGANQRGSSLSSHSSCCDDDQEHEDNNNNNNNKVDRAHENIDYLEELLGLRSLSGPESQGTIKLTRRCCSSSSSSSGNFGRTLVCSVSPTSQMRAAPNGGVNVVAHIGGGGGDNDDEHSYPINGEEIRQCRAAFRENRRLIERVHDEARKRLERPQCDVHLTGGLKRSSSQGAFDMDETNHRARGVDKSHWAHSLGRRTRLPDCSRCGLKLYPLDKMELRFHTHHTEHSSQLFQVSGVRHPTEIGDIRLDRWKSLLSRSCQMHLAIALSRPETGTS